MTSKNLSIGLASISLLGGTLLFSSGAPAQSAQPSPDGSRIQFPTTGYWLVRDSAGVELCQGSSSNGTSNNYGTSGLCENLPTGSYSVENLSSTGNADDAVVVIGQNNGGNDGGGGSGNDGSSPLPDGARIQFPTTGYWLVRNSAGVEICQGNSSNGTSNSYGTAGRCENLPNGTYSVENLSSAGNADDAVIIIGQNTGGDDNSGDGGSDGGNDANSPFPDGARIQFPTNGYWLVRNSAGAEICQGNSSNGTSNNYGNSGSCENLPNGTYTVELLGTNEPDVTVSITAGSNDGGSGGGDSSGGAGFPDFSDNKLKDIRLNGNILSWARPTNETNGVYEIILNDNDAGGGAQSDSRRADYVDYVAVANLGSNDQNRYSVDVTALSLNAIGTNGLQAGQNFAVRTGDFSKSRIVTVPSSIPVNVVSEAVAGKFDERISAIVNGLCNTSTTSGCPDQTALDGDTINVLNGNWSTVFREDFNDLNNRQLSSRSFLSGNAEDRNQQNWYFAEVENGAFTGVSPDGGRVRSTDDQHAILRNNLSYQGNSSGSAGVLEMTATKRPNSNGGQYSYMATANNQRQGWFIDPSSPVYIETSVRLDKAVDTVNAWWAIWLMTPGNGDGFNAYDCNANTGTEIDILEFVPEAANGFNTALFREVDDIPEEIRGNCSDRLSLPGLGQQFSYRNRTQFDNGLNNVGELPNYVDGKYHKIGFYYSEDLYALFIDNKLVGKIYDSEHSNWITKSARESIRLTWEIDNRDKWGVADPGLTFSDHTPKDSYSTFVDYVYVFQSQSANNVITQRGATAKSQPEKATLISPVNSQTVSARAPVELSWEDDFLATKYRTRVYDRNLPGWTTWVQHEAADICGNDECTINGPVLAESKAANLFWQVNAGNDHGWSGATAFRNGTFRVFEDDKPPIPTMVSPLDGDIVPSNEPVTLIWDADEQALRYQVRRYDRVTKSWSYIENHWKEDVCSVSTCSIEVPGTDTHDSSFWRVLGWNRRGNGTWSDYRSTRFHVRDQ